MKKYKKISLKRTLNQSGQAMSEYLILVMLVAAASTVAATGVGRSVYNKLETIKTSINGVKLESVREPN